MAEEPVKQNEKKEVNDEKAQTSSTQERQPQRSTGGPRNMGQRGGSGPRNMGQRSGGGSFRGGRQQSGQRPYQRRRFHRRKVCLFCADKSKEIDWKKLENLRRFTGDNGSMYPRRKSGLCAKHQRQIAVAIKRARHIALLPYTTEHVRIMSKS